MATLVHRSIIAFVLLAVSSGVHYDEIPVGTSKEDPDGWTCGLLKMPDHVLLKCTDPITPGKPDMRGDWTDGHHWERIEQCASRYTVSGPGRIPKIGKPRYYIHDFVSANGTVEGGAKDYNAAVFPACLPITTIGTLNSTTMLMEGVMGSKRFVGATRTLNPDGTLSFYNFMLGKIKVLHRTNDPPPDFSEAASVLV